MRIKINQKANFNISMYNISIPMNQQIKPRKSFKQSAMNQVVQPQIEQPIQPVKRARKQIEPEQIQVLDQAPVQRSIKPKTERVTLPSKGPAIGEVPVTKVRKVKPTEQVTQVDQEPVQKTRKKKAATSEPIQEHPPTQSAEHVFEFPIKPNKNQKVKLIGNRDDVWNYLAQKTSGGLTRDDLKVNARGQIVSKLASEASFSKLRKIGSRSSP